MGKIPEHEYVDAGGFKVVTYQLVELHHTPGEVESFCRWMGGQTCAVLDDGSAGIYSWDYERWLREGRLDCQLPGTWD